MGCASGYLGCLHVCILLIGLAYVGISAYLLVEGNNFLPSGADQFAWASYVPLIFGCVIVVIAFLGLCCESISKNRCFIGLFALLQLAFGAVIIAAGALFVLFSGQYITVIADSQNVVADVPPGPQDIQLVLANVLLGLQVGCCNTGAIPACDDEDNSPIVEGDREFCFDPTYEEEYAAAIESAQLSNSTFCAIDSLEESCDAEAPISEWIDANQELMSTFLWPAGIAFVIFGCLLILAFCASCSLMCRSREEEPKSRKKEQYAGDTAGTGSGGARTDNRNINYA